MGWPMAQLTLALDPPSAANPGRATWFLDGHPFGDPAPADHPPSSDVARQFLELFDHRDRRPVVDAEGLRALGRRLFDRYFAPVWTDLSARLTGPGHELLVRSADGALLNLPWEL